MTEAIRFDRPRGFYRPGEGGCTCWPPSAPDFHDRPPRIAGPRGAHDEACAVYRAWQDRAVDECGTRHVAFAAAGLIAAGVVAVVWAIARWLR